LPIPKTNNFVLEEISTDGQGHRSSEGKQALIEIDQDVSSENNNPSIIPSDSRL